MNRNFILFRLLRSVPALTLTLTLTLTPTLYSQEMETVKFDFNEPGVWKTADTQDGKTSFVNGSIVLTSKLDGVWSQRIHFPVDPNYDYSFEAGITQLSGESNCPFGILFGQGSWEDYTSYSITSNGYFKLYGESNNVSKEYVPWTKSDKINPLGKKNILRLDKVKDSIHLYINHTRVRSIRSIYYFGVKIGLITNFKMEMSVDYLSVKRRKQNFVQIKDAVNGFKKENLGENINTKTVEKAPLISPDGRTMFVTRDDHPQNTGDISMSDIWISHLLEDGTWSKLEKAPAPLNNDGNNFVVSVTPDGNTLLLGNTYTATGGVKSAGVSISNLRDGKWGIPVDQEILNFKNSNKFVNYFLTSDGKKLLIAGQNEKSFGDLDLYISFLREDGKWDEPKNMGSVLNSYSGDFAPFLAPDGKTLFFCSYGHPGYGSADVFVSRRLDDTWLNWSVPENLGPEINSSDWDAYLVLSAKGEYAYLVSSESGFGEEDVFRIKVPKSVRPQPVELIFGKVIDAKTNLPINAAITYEVLGEKIQLGKASSTKENGYKIALPGGIWYAFRATAPGYVPVSENIDLTKLSVYGEKEVNLYLVPLEAGQTVRINNLFFDFNKATIRKESFRDLDILVELMKKNPTMKIEIGGHTDNVGTELYNNDLSLRRANAVADYLVSQGVEKDRLSFKGYGMSKPVTSNETEEGRQKNRRVEFLIINR